MKRKRKCGGKEGQDRMGGDGKEGYIKEGGRD